MSQKSLELKKYPIGRFEAPEKIQEELLEQWAQSLELLPRALEETLANTKDEDLDKMYRPGSWTVRQLVHHMADSHLNGYLRMKLALTEDKPTIKPFEENAWVELSDIEDADIEVSLQLISSLHRRWLALISKLNTAELSRSFYHPDNKLNISVAECIGLYAWHGEHHLAHIREALIKGD